MQKNLKLLSGDTLKNQSLIDEKDSTKSLEQIKNILSKTALVSDQLLVIKIPKEVIIDEKLLFNYIENICHLVDIGANVIVVHDFVSPEEFFGISEQNPFINFHLTSDKYFLEMFTCGYIGRKIISIFNYFSISSVNVAAKDSEMIIGHKIRSHDFNDSGIVNVNFSGKPESMDPSFLLMLQEAKIVPVISPIAKNDKDGNFLINSDYTASLIAIVMDANYLILPSKDILSSIEINNFTGNTISMIRDIQKQNSHYHDLFEAGITAIDDGIENVAFINSLEEDSILKTIFSTPILNK